MAVSTDLFDLIKTLDKAEKSFFIKDTFKGSKDNLYLKMFRYIDSQKQYDEQKLIKKLKEVTGFKNIATSKNYLYKIIIASLKKYQNEKHINFIIRDKLAEVEILYSRGLNTKCLQKIIKAVKFCLKNELPEYELLFLKYKYSIFQLYEKKDDIDVSEFENVLERLVNLNTYMKFGFIGQSYLNKIGFFMDRRQALINELKEFIEKEPLFRNENLAITYYSKVLFYNYNAMVADIKGDTQKSFEINKKQLAFMEKEFYKTLNKPNSIVAAYGNHLSLCNALNEDQEYLLTLNKLKTLHLKHEAFNSLNIQARIFERLANSDIHYHLRLLDFDMVFKLINQYLNQFKSLESHLSTSRKFIFHLAIAKSYFYSGDFEKTLEVLNNMIAANKDEITDSLVITANLMLLIVYFELELYSLIESVLRRINRLLKLLDRMSEEDKLLIKYFNRLLKSPIEEYSGVFDELWRELKSINANKSPKSRLKYYGFDVYAWLQCKAEKKELIDVIKARNKSHNMI